MSLAAILLIVGVVGLSDVVVISVLASSLRTLLQPLAAAYPVVPPRPDAVRRDFQSFRIEMFSFGFCIHVAADQDHLHLSPALLPRLFRTPALSVPWSAITLKPARPKARVIKADIRAGNATVSISGPRWCLALAEPVSG